MSEKYYMKTKDLNIPRLMVNEKKKKKIKRQQGDLT